MKRSMFTGSVLSVLAAGATFAHDYRAGPLQIMQPWARATPEGVKNGAAYLSIVNAGQEPDTLLAVQTEASASVEMHETVHDGDVMRMREIRDGIAIAPGATLTFAPGRAHLMLVGLTRTLADGTDVQLKLTFAKAGVITVEANVQKNAPAAAPGSPIPVDGMPGMHHE